MECYGKYRPSKKCDACDLIEWCRDSARIDMQSWEIPYDSVECFVPYLPSMEPERSTTRTASDILHEILVAVEGDGIDGARMAAIALNKLVRISYISDLTFKAVVTKFIHPDMSLSEISDYCGLGGRQHAKYHISRAIELVPELESCILMDNRKNKDKYYAKKDNNEGD